LSVRSSNAIVRRTIRPPRETLSEPVQSRDTVASRSAGILPHTTIMRNPAAADALSIAVVVGSLASASVATLSLSIAAAVKSGWAPNSGASSAVVRPPLGCSRADDTSWLSPPPALSRHAAAGRVSNKARGREP
jgi:hypothetical protein